MTKISNFALKMKGGGGGSEGGTCEVLHIEKFMVCICRVSVGFVGDSWQAVLQGSMRTLKNVRHD